MGKSQKGAKQITSETAIEFAEAFVHRRNLGTTWEANYRLRIAIQNDLFG